MAGFMPYRDGVATGSYRLPWASWAPASNGATLAECPESRKKSVYERADRCRHRTFSFTAGAGERSVAWAPAAPRDPSRTRRMNGRISGTAVNITARSQKSSA